MDSKMRPIERNFSGEFRAQEMAQGCWRISQSQPQNIDIFVRGTDRNSGLLLGGGGLLTLGVEWRSAGALLRLTAGRQTAVLEASSVLVHESLERLYAALPLAVFDATAQRFWSRVFAIVRLPGGRLLLRYLARSGRRRP